MYCCSGVDFKRLARFQNSRTSRTVNRDLMRNFDRSLLSRYPRFYLSLLQSRFFKPHLKQLYPEKLDIDQLLEVYRHNVHPLELVSSAQSFQNAAGIDRAFSKFLGNGGLWSSVLKLQVRIKDDPSTESGFAHDELDALKRIFALRHELVHDPARRAYFSEEILQDMYAAAHLIFGSDIILSGVIQENRDPTMEND